MRAIPRGFIADSTVPCGQKNAARLAVRPSFDRALKVYLGKRGSCEAERELGWAVQAEQTRSRGG